MSMRKPRVILLTGAPDASSLKAKKEPLTDEFSTEFETLLNRGILEHNATSSLTPKYPKWRSLAVWNVDEPRSSQDLPHGFDIAPGHQPGRGVGAHLEDIVNRPLEDEEFLEHSFLANQDISNALSASPSDASISNASTRSEHPSFLSTLTDSFSTSPRSTDSLLTRLPITDIRALPSQQDLSRLYPQTITPTLLGGIISTTPPRTVCINASRPARRGTRTAPQQMDIVELFIGDDTGTGFRVTFWLETPPATTTSSRPESVAQRQNRAEQSRLRRRLLSLRRGDVVLLAHVVLSTFRGRVYGQSLRRRGGRGAGGVCTGVFRIGEEVVVREDCVNGEKLRRVRRWVDEFVGPPVRIARRRDVNEMGGRFNRRIRLDEDLPNDTQ